MKTTSCCPGRWWYAAVLCALGACGGPPAATEAITADTPPPAVQPATPHPADAPESPSLPVEAEPEWDDLADLPEDHGDVLLLMTDPDPTIRQDVIDAILEAGAVSYRELLRAALHDPHAGVREAAAEALEELGE